MKSTEISRLIYCSLKINNFGSRTKTETDVSLLILVTSQYLYTDFWLDGV